MRFWINYQSQRHARKRGKKPRSSHPLATLYPSVKMMALLRRSNAILQLDSAGVWIKMDMSLRELEQEESLTALPLVRIVKMSDLILISWFCLSLSMQECSSNNFPRICKQGTQSLNLLLHL